MLAYYRFFGQKVAVRRIVRNNRSRLCRDKNVSSRWDGEAVPVSSKLLYSRHMQKKVRFCRIFISFKFQVSSWFFVFS